jgi:hypothetical protein
MDLNVINTVAFVIIAVCLLVQTFAGGLWRR